MKGEVGKAGGGGGFWTGPVTSTPQARMILNNATGALFSLGVMSLLAGLALGAIGGAAIGIGVGGQGIVLIVMAFVAKKLRSLFVFGALAVVLALASLGNFTAVMLGMADLTQFPWAPLIGAGIAAGLGYAMLRAMRAVRYLQEHPEISDEVFE